MSNVLVATAALALALALARAIRSDTLHARLASLEAPLGRFGPWIAAAVSVAIVWYVWGELLPIAKIQDESSYVLQSEIFARGRWTLPSPVIPEFFEQPHVLVVPALASKYPPGHALLLAVGALVGFPALVPLLLTGVSGALVFALARRLSNPWVALLTWWLWITAPIVLKFQPGYLSEGTTGTLWLAAWWWLLDWRRTRARRPLLLLAAAIGWCAITRPLTAVVVAIPVGILVLWTVVRAGGARDLGLAMIVGTAVLAILPLWSARTTGDWKEWPVERYRKDYMPFDKPGFSADTSAPRRAVSPVIRSLNHFFSNARKQQTVDALPGIATRRAFNLVIGWFQNVRLPLLVFAVAGLFALTGPVAFGLATAALLFVAHLSYAHDPAWTVYYVEATPVIAMLIALGIWRLSRWATRGEARAPMAAALTFAVLVPFALPAIGDWRDDHRTRGAFDRRFAQGLEGVEGPAIVFLRYSPRLTVHPSVVFNFVNPERAPVWVVHDLGARNRELQTIAPERRAYVLDEEELLRWAVDADTRPLPLEAIAAGQASRPQTP
jgi:hypothetical protein